MELDIFTCTYSYKCTLNRSVCVCMCTVLDCNNSEKKNQYIYFYCVHLQDKAPFVKIRKYMSVIKKKKKNIQVKTLLLLFLGPQSYYVLPQTSRKKHRESNEGKKVPQTPHVFVIEDEKKHRGISSHNFQCLCFPSSDSSALLSFSHPDPSPWLAQLSFSQSLALPNRRFVVHHLKQPCFKGET